MQAVEVRASQNWSASGGAGFGAKTRKGTLSSSLFFGVFVMPLNLYFVTAKSILGYSEDSTRQDGFVFFCGVCSGVGSVRKLDCVRFGPDVFETAS